MTNSENSGSEKKQEISKWSKEQKTSVTLMAVIVLGLIGGGYWFVAKTSNLFSRISPSRSMAPSSSMKPYELSFRIANENGTVNEWKLAVPRAFVIDVSGSNDEQFWVALSLQENEERKLVPRTFSKNRVSENSGNYINITLGNTASEKWMSDNNVCVSVSEKEKVAKSFGARSRSKPCLEQDKNCSIETQLNGWAIGISAPKKLYANTEQVCEMAKVFLNEHTINRDQIR